MNIQNDGLQALLNAALSLEESSSSLPADRKKESGTFYEGTSIEHVLQGNAFKEGSNKKSEKRKYQDLKSFTEPSQSDASSLDAKWPRVALATEEVLPAHETAVSHSSSDIERLIKEAVYGSDFFPVKAKENLFRVPVVGLNERSLKKLSEAEKYFLKKLRKTALLRGLNEQAAEEAVIESVIRIYLVNRYNELNEKNESLSNTERLGEAKQQIGACLHYLDEKMSSSEIGRKAGKMATITLNSILFEKLPADNISTSLDNNLSNNEKAFLTAQRDKTQLDGKSEEEASEFAVKELLKKFLLPKVKEQIPQVKSLVSKKDVAKIKAALSFLDLKESSANEKERVLQRASRIIRISKAAHEEVVK